MKLWPARKRETPPDNGALQPQISAFWDQLFGTTATWSPTLLERLWVANRCMQLCSQQIAQMPLRFFGSRKPAWLANPDPVWYPNGIGDVVFAAAWSMYGYGDAFLYVTDRYADGFPSAFTVLDPSTMNVQVVDGRRAYRARQVELDPDNVVQIMRNPTGAVRGTSALAAFAPQAWGMVAASELGKQLVSSGGIPNAVLKSQRKLTQEQAQAIQTNWMDARARSSIGAPAVLPPEISFEQLSFSAGDVALLDVMQYDARAIAAAFGVPSFMLNMPLEGGLTYQNPETLFEVWWREELRPAAGRIQRALTASMLPAGAWVEFDARAVLAPTFQGQVTSWTELLKEGVVTKDEVRAAILHLPPIEQGEALDELTEPPSAAASPADDVTGDAVVTVLHPTGVMSP